MVTVHVSNTVVVPARRIWIESVVRFAPIVAREIVQVGSVDVATQEPSVPVGVRPDDTVALTSNVPPADVGVTHCWKDV